MREINSKFNEASGISPSASLRQDRSTNRSSPEGAFLRRSLGPNFCSKRAPSLYSPMFLRMILATSRKTRREVFLRRREKKPTATSFAAARRGGPRGIGHVHHLPMKTFKQETTIRGEHGPPCSLLGTESCSAYGIRDTL